MRKPLFLIMLIAFIIAVAGIWGAVSIRAHLSNQQNSPHDSTSLYTTGTRVIPTVKVSTSSTNCAPKSIPGAALDAAGGIGSLAIKPHLCSIPTFTEKDVRQYMSTVSSFTGHRIGQTSAHFTIIRILFVTNQVANDILNADTGVTGNTLIVCYVEVYGDFTVASPFAPKDTKQTILHHGQMVFDGVTGNMLVIGVAP